MEYQSSLEPIFMKAFHAAMIGGVAVALAGVIISFLRGPENSRKHENYE